MNNNFLQSDLWAEINEIYNNKKPVKINHEKISCMFGYDKTTKALTSYAGPEVDEYCNLEEWNVFFKSLTQFNFKPEKIIFTYIPPFRNWTLGVEQLFGSFNFNKIDWKTAIINLSEQEDIIFQNLNHSVRKSINKFDRLGLSVFKCETFFDYYEKYLINYDQIKSNTSKPYHIIEKCWNLTAPHNIYTYWILYGSNNEIMGMLGTFRYNGVATEIMSATSNLAYKYKVPTQDILHWEAIRYHKKLGDQYFDLAGFNPNPTNQKEVNIRRFKEKWGGKVYDIPSYTLDMRTLAQKIKSKISRIIHV